MTVALFAWPYFEPHNLKLFFRAVFFLNSSQLRWPKKQNGGNGIITVFYNTTKNNPLKYCQNILTLSLSIFSNK